MSRFILVSERAKLNRASAISLAAGLSVLLTACAEPGPVASYDRTTRRLVRLDSDLDGDGAVDHRAYMDGTLALRAETDRELDGRVDRWEYFDGAAQLLVVGTSSKGDGVEDTWTWAPDAGGERRVDLSLERDRVIDRREFFRGTSLIRAEADTNADGRIDRWETFEAGTLVQVALDTTFAADRPNRRLTYERDGRFRAVEIDPDGNGDWEQLR